LLGGDLIVNAEHAELRVTAGRLAGTEQETEHETEQKSEREAHDEPEAYSAASVPASKKTQVCVTPKKSRPGDKPRSRSADGFVARFFATLGW